MLVTVELVWIIMMLVVLNTILEFAFVWLLKKIFEYEIEPVGIVWIMLYIAKWFGLFQVINYYLNG
jgi:hypothetical protein